MDSWESVTDIPQYRVNKLVSYKFAKNGGTTEDGQKFFPLTKVSESELTNRFKQAHHSKGRAFETFMGSFFRGDFGQYFTPRNIVSFIVDSLPIKKTDRILDTSCGSGGFLLHALDKIRTEVRDFYGWKEEGRGVQGML